MKVRNVSCSLASVFGMTGQSKFKCYIGILNTLCFAGFTRTVIPVEGAPMKSWLADDELVTSLC